MKTFLVTIGSLTLTLLVVINAFHQKKQFYPSILYITRSNVNMAVIYFQALICVSLFGKLVCYIFFGQLRSLEIENLIERSWYSITETCLAFTIFRDDLNPKFIALFTILLFLKCFHWLTKDRVDLMERTANISFLFHFRIITVLFVLASLNIMFIKFAYINILIKGTSVQLVFGFEYAILLTTVLSILVKYLLICYDSLHRDTPWENKGIYLLYFELALSLLKAFLYFSFIIIITKMHSFPLFAIRSMYLAIRSFEKKFIAVILSRKAIRNMNTMYPDATPEDLANTDNVCIICREEMIGNSSAKKLPCNHIFHVSCLRSWFQRQQSCPTCRMDVLGIVPQNPPPQNLNLRILLAGFNPIFNNIGAIFRQERPQNQQNPAPNNQQQNREIQPESEQQNNSQNNVQNNNLQNNTNNTNNSNPGNDNSFNNFNHPFMSIPLLPFLPFQPISSTTNNLPSSLNLSKLSLEELKKLELSERKGLEERIKFLQNLRTSMDTLILQFHQYNQIISRPQIQSTDQNLNDTSKSTNETLLQSTSASTSLSSEVVDSKTNKKKAS